MKKATRAHNKSAKLIGLPEKNGKDRLFKSALLNVALCDVNEATGVRAYQQNESGNVI